PWYPGCTVGTNCSEPHEPYLNIIYPEDACCAAAGAPNPVTIGWEDPDGLITRRPKSAIDDAGTMPTVDSDDICTVVAQYPFCTSNGYDRDGYADHWAGAQAAPILNGVFYNQGTYTSTGNARLFGSVLINGNVDPSGTNEVWFDERLIKNEWPPSDWPFPRVIITAIETDQ
ncbi:MAG TPA: hypothetical protein VG106_05560, partial [Vicinamibacterales bacterium]|nr:hypothetical protein [Vicinamibacterales bacterium]